MPHYVALDFHQLTDENFRAIINCKFYRSHENEMEPRMFNNFHQYQQSDNWLGFDYRNTISLCKSRHYTSYTDHQYRESYNWLGFVCRNTMSLRKSRHYKLYTDHQYRESYNWLGLVCRNCPSVSKSRHYKSYTDH